MLTPEQEKDLTETHSFYAKHCAAGGVVLVQTDDNHLAVFSTLKGAVEWSKKQEQPCVTAPYVIDEPDYGNVPKGQQN